MQDSNNPQPQDSQDQPAATFKPAPNPFEKSTTAPVEMASPAQEETQVPPEPEQDSPVTAAGAQNDIELVGKRADEKPESGQLEQPKKRSAVAAVFSPFSKKPEPADTKTKHKNLNKWVFENEDEFDLSEMTDNFKSNKHKHFLGKSKS